MVTGFTPPDGVERLAALIGGAHRIVVFTGAGVSTASGIPDFRGPQGVWQTRRPIFYADFMSSAEARREYWAQKLADTDELGGAVPNATHDAIVDLERAGRIEMVVTQNVDGLHAAAGTSAPLLVEVHGTARLVECQTCGEQTLPEPHFESFLATNEAPSCHCGGHLKSATISFGQSLRTADLDRANVAAGNADLVLALGSTLSVHPAADIPLVGTASGAAYAIVNRGPTEHDRRPDVTLRVEGDVTEVVPAAVRIAIN